MALPVAHGLVGATIAALLVPDPAGHNRRTILTASAVGISPDLDYVFYQFLGWGEGWHRSFSHSIVFAVVAGVLVAFVVGPRSWLSIVIYSLAAVSHSVLDAVVSEQGGVQFLWPLSHRFHFGLVGYPNVFAGKPDVYTVAIRILECSLVEMIIFAPLLVAVLWVRSRARLGGSAA